jgi:hypothetical protein
MKRCFNFLNAGMSAAALSTLILNTCLSLSLAPSTQTIITTFAGLNAANGTLDYPSSVALDSKGNLFITDSGNNRIRALTTINNRRSQLTSQ